ncbi:MAG: response regulator [Candidatus Omnitrophica bacterium]|jgi:two-component system response regulator (stage 0 sporulation protein F)|nr:response regulator [Candidatus Omnitrophota bacterium]MDD5079806.1 response regulator [Candidatus Omnitrophota bacterium]
MWKEKILIADNDLDARNLLYEILFSLNYEVTCVPTGEEALARLSEERFDLIILNEAMPGLSGWDTARKIRGFDKQAHIIIFAVDSQSDEAQAKVLALRVSAVVKKDFSTHFMVKTILGVLRSEEGGIHLAADASNAGRRILVVDDNLEIRNVLQDFLGKKGYKVDVSSSGMDALMSVRTEAPQVVLLDMRMPGMDGLMVLNQIKKINGSIKVIMLTSVQDEHVMEEAAKEGACDYLLKPCDLQKLDEIITSLFVTAVNK